MEKIEIIRKMSGKSEEYVLGFFAGYEAGKGKSSKGIVKELEPKKKILGKNQKRSYKKKNNCKRWSVKDDQMLKALWLKYKSPNSSRLKRGKIKIIARELKRSPASIHCRIHTCKTIKG